MSPMRLEDITPAAYIITFLYYDAIKHQYLRVRAKPPYDDEESEEEIFRRFQRAHHRAHATRSTAKQITYFQQSRRYAIIARIDPKREWELYVAMNPFATKS